MSQRITSIYKLITFPSVYEGVQTALGARKLRRYLANGPLQTRPGDRVLDVGCGPATLRPLLGDVEYLGMDLNAPHIAQATEKYGHMGRFICGNAVSDIENAPGPFDLIICLGLLHHLDDDEAEVLITALSTRLAPGGRLVTNDPVFIERQNPVARFIKNRDSGENIRTKAGYTALFAKARGQLESAILSGRLHVPYNHCCNTLTNSA